MLQGGIPSFNNLLDLDVAYRIASDYTTPTVVIAKHTDPVGLASADELVEAYRRALETDPVASFGALVGGNLALDGSQLQVVTKRRPTLEELTDLLFAWRAVRHVRSNAIVLAKNAATVGIGSGQASRQVSVEIALRRAGDRARLSVLPRAA